MTDLRCTTFEIRALPQDRVDAIRGAGVDEFGNKVEVTTVSEGGAPLRCCLREATPGERVALIAWCPFGQPGPYAEVGPVFIHADRCAGYPDGGGYPLGYRDRPQIFRSYGHDGRIVDAEIVGGAEAETDEAIGRLLARPEVAFVHSRNVTYGCYMFEIRRAS
jgi:Protein of unknown function (DUF1203)